MNLEQFHSCYTPGCFPHASDARSYNPSRQYIPLVAQSSYYMASQPLTQYADPGFGVFCDS